MRILFFLVILLLLRGANLFASPVSIRPIQQNIFTYIGESSDPYIKTMMLGGYRTYRPDDGQFSKQDGYSPFQNELTLNGFNYTAGNPIFWADLTGHTPNSIEHPAKWIQDDLDTVTSIWRRQVDADSQPIFLYPELYPIESAQDALAQSISHWGNWSNSWNQMLTIQSITRTTTLNEQLVKLHYRQMPQLGDQYNQALNSTDLNFIKTTTDKVDDITSTLEEMHQIARTENLLCAAHDKLQIFQHNAPIVETAEQATQTDEVMIITQILQEPLSGTTVSL